MTFEEYKKRIEVSFALIDAMQDKLDLMLEENAKTFKRAFDTLERLERIDKYQRGMGR